MIRGPPKPQLRRDEPMFEVRAIDPPIDGHSPGRSSFECWVVGSPREHSVRVREGAGECTRVPGILCVSSLISTPVGGGPLGVGQSAGRLVKSFQITDYRLQTTRLGAHNTCEKFGGLSIGQSCWGCVLVITSCHTVF